MGKKKLTPVEAGKGQPTVKSCYVVVGKPSENKNEEKLLKTDKEIALSAGINESNDNDCTTIRTEKGTIMGPNTAPTDDGKDLELDKTNDKNKEDVENSGEEDEDEDGSPNKIKSEFNDDQES